MSPSRAHRRRLAHRSRRGGYSGIDRSFDIRPRELVASARQAPREAFVEQLRGAPVLLVHVGESDELLVRALDASSSRRGQPLPPSPDGLPFRTATMRIRFGQTSAQRASALSGVLQAAVLHKRAGSQTLSEHRICIGRSHGNDVVLRDPSVSKLHAWFERDEDGNYFLIDANSHNGTQLDGEPIVARRAMHVTSGDSVLFGSVLTTFFSAADLWEAAQSACR